MAKKALITALCCALLPIAAAAQNVARVVAVVNDSVIINQELERRYQLVLRQVPTDLPDQEKDLLRRKTLGALIDEEIKRQYAARYGWQVPQEMIAQRMALLDNRNPEFKKIIAGLEDAAESQIKNDILWEMIIQRRIQPRVTVSNEEIDRLIEGLISGEQKTERELSQIFLAVDEDNDTQVRNRASQLANQLENGENFKSIAQAFSEDANASKGGYLGWFADGELSPTLEQALEGLKPGEISTPVRSASGWHILRVENMRLRQTFETEAQDQVYLIQLAMTLPEENKGDAKDKFRDLLKDSESLAGFEEALESVKDDSAFSASGELGWLNVENVPSHFDKALKNLKPGQRSGIIEDEGTLYAIYLASARKKLSDKLERYRERVRERLASSRVELMARRFLRDERRKAFIDIKL